MGGVPPDVSEEELGSHFAPFGTVLRAEIMKEVATGKPRGFGFVSFAEEGAVGRAPLSRARHPPYNIAMRTVAVCMANMCVKHVCHTYGNTNPKPQYIC